MAIISDWHKLAEVGLNLQSADEAIARQGC
jgi:hypothetical protein